jgi:hypothetical protein
MFSCGRVEAGLAFGVGDAPSVFAGSGGSCAQSHPSGTDKAIDAIAKRNLLRFIRWSAAKIGCLLNIEIKQGIASARRKTRRI